VLKEAKFGKWLYYTNDEGKPRWKCNECRKIIRRGAHDKLYCSHCEAKMSMES